jgi:hypothetical protein
MEMPLAIVALLLAVMSIGLAVHFGQQLPPVRREAQGASEGVTRAQGTADAATGQVAELRQEVATLRQEIAELRAAIETPVLAPVRTTPSRNLDDLREHLRAAHATPDEDDEA